MTHSEIYKKFFIEYDKDMITSSYPSLTLIEVSNFLNKAYLALIAQKFTGNNLRQVPFEGDTKQLEDLQPLIVTSSIEGIPTYGDSVKNGIIFQTPINMLYYVDSRIQYTLTVNDVENIILIPHQHVRRFMHTAHNMPWIENPVCVISNNTIRVYYDDYSHKRIEPWLYIDYIKRPQMFNGESTDDVKFELSDSVVEELINLAITFVLDNVESSRIQTKTNLLKLES